MRALVATSNVGRGGNGPLRPASVTVGGMPVGFEVVELPDTEFDPRSEENAHRVLVRVRGFSMNFRDASWVHDRALHPDASPLDRAVGSEFVGEVVAVGAEVEEFRCGDRVMPEMAWPSNGVPGTVGGVPTNSASVELQAFHAGKLVRVPGEMPDEVAAGFVLGAQTAFSMVRRLHVRPADHVLVTAATSSTSLFAIQALGTTGAKVYALTRSGHRAAALRQLGVVRVFEPETYAPSGGGVLSAFVAEIHGFKAVVDPFANLYLGTALRALGFFGKYITCGMLDRLLHVSEGADAGTIDVAALANLLIVKNLSMMGNCLGLRQDLESSICAWEKGDLRVVLDSVFRHPDVDGFVARHFARDKFGKTVYLYC